MSSARASISDSFWGWREEVTVISSSKISMCLSSSMHSRISAPDLGAQEPLPIMATVRFCRFSAFMSIRKLCIGGKIPRL